MLTSPIMRRNNHFTLIEMIAVTAIIALSTGLAVSAFRDESSVRKLNRIGLEFESFCAGVRYQAMEHGEERIVFLNPADHSLEMKTPEMLQEESLQPESLPEIRTVWKFPEEMILELPESPETESAELFRFFPDGGAAGMRDLVFQYRSLQKTYRLSPLTGRVILYEGENE